MPGEPGLRLPMLLVKKIESETTKIIGKIIREREKINKKESLEKKNKIRNKKPKEK